MECGGSEGHAYRLGGYHTGKWEDNKISAGQTILIENEGKFDILTKDAAGFRSATEDGANVVIVGNSKTMINVVE